MTITAWIVLTVCSIALPVCAYKIVRLWGKMSDAERHAFRQGQR